MTGSVSTTGQTTNRKSGKPYNPYERFRDTELILRDQLAIDRTALANERTLLAFGRTSLTLIVTGTGAIRFFDGWSAHTTGWGLIALGLALVPIGLYRYLATNRNIGAAGQIARAQHDVFEAMRGDGDGI